MTYPTTPIELTIREKQVLALYAQGTRQQAIADMLGISRFTVVNTLDRCQQRLYLKDRWALRDYAKSNGLDKVEQEAAVKREYEIALREGGYYACFPEQEASA